MLILLPFFYDQPTRTKTVYLVKVNAGFEFTNIY